MTLFICQFSHPVGWRGMGKRDWIEIILFDAVSIGAKNVT